MVLLSASSVCLSVCPAVLHTSFCGSLSNIPPETNNKNIVSSFIPDTLRIWHSEVCSHRAEWCCCSSHYHIDRTIFLSCDNSSMSKCDLFVPVIRRLSWQTWGYLYNRALFTKTSSNPFPCVALWHLALSSLFPSHLWPLTCPTHDALSVSQPVPWACADAATTLQKLGQD